MQTKELCLVSGIPRLAADRKPRRFRRAEQDCITMSKTASLRYVPSTGLFARLVNAIDRLLMANALIAVRNGDLPYFGL